jgi:hypothetical protein
VLWQNKKSGANVPFDCETEFRKWKQRMETPNLGLVPKHGQFDSTACHQEVRCAVRFPLTLPVTLFIGPREETGLTRNVSASGVLFDLESPLNVGQSLRFSLRMPGVVLGNPQDVLVRCCGRVVRCSVSQSQYQAAATIDEYRFEEQ